MYLVIKNDIYLCVFYSHDNKIQTDNQEQLMAMAKTGEPVKILFGTKGRKMTQKEMEL